MTVGDKFTRAMNRAAKWRFLFAAWQVGDRWRTADDPEVAAIMDHREATLMTRIELSTLRELLISKGVLTVEECQTQAIAESEKLITSMQERFPGVTVGDDDRLHLDDAADTMARLHLKID